LGLVDQCNQAFCALSGKILDGLLGLIGSGVIPSIVRRFLVAGALRRAA
jgi:hypothetical protein